MVVVVVVVARLGELGECVQSLVAKHGNGLPLATATPRAPLLAVAGGEGAAPLEQLLQIVAGVTNTAGTTGLVDTTIQEFTRATDLLGPRRPSPPTSSTSPGEHLSSPGFKLFLTH